MRRINTPNRVVDLNGPGKDGWRSGNKAANLNPTENSGEFMNIIQEELAAFPEFVGSALDPNNKQQVLQAVLAMIESRVGSISGKNKLLNTNFENPVNQLGKASRITTAGAYNFDCWYYGADTKFYQAADYLNLSASQQYTLNWSGTATAEYLFSTSRSATIEAQAGWTAIAKGAQITAPADVVTGAKFLWIRWAGVTAALATFDKPQLEEGTIATTYERSLFQDQKRWCQTYLPAFSFYSGNEVIGQSGWANSATSAFCAVKLPQTARFPVTGIISTGTMAAIIPGYSNVALSSLALSLASDTCPMLTATSTSGAAFASGIWNLTSGLLAFTGAQI